MVLNTFKPCTQEAEADSRSARATLRNHDSKQTNKQTNKKKKRVRLCHKQTNKQTNKQKVLDLVILLE
jgi:hypothetical protein